MIDETPATGPSHGAGRRESWRHKPLSALTVLALILLVFSGGLLGGVLLTRQQLDSSGLSDQGVKEFLTAYHLVTQRSYFRPLDRHQLIYSAIDGMLAATGDPHTLFLSPQEQRTANQQLNGSGFSGIGAIISALHGRMYVVTPFPGSPAAEAGLQSGDEVVRINGRPAAAASGEVQMSRLRGPAGTEVRLQIRHRGQLKTVRVQRRHIPAITAYGRILPHRIGYLQILSFGQPTGGQVKAALRTLQADHMKALILDLRGNPGGYVDTARQVASQFLSRGPIAYEESSASHLQPLTLLPHEQPVTIPMAALVDQGTASAAEITAGALQDYARAKLFGTRTYGKASMQSVYSLPDGSSLRITDRLWLTPRHHSIQRGGIKPDVLVFGEPGPLSDPQLSAAEHYLLRHASR